MSTELLSSGIFGITEAARLLRLKPERLRWWVANPRHEPVIKSSLPTIAHRVALSFINLIEAQFIKFFAEEGVHLNSIRVMAREAKRILKHPHPFATDVLFKTDGRTIFALTYEKTNDPRLYNLRTHNWAMP